MSDRIRTPCPACGYAALFIGKDGALECGSLGCPEPVVERAIARLKASSATQLLHATSKALEALEGYGFLWHGLGHEQTGHALRVLQQVYEDAMRGLPGELVDVIAALEAALNEREAQLAKFRRLMVLFAEADEIQRDLTSGPTSTLGEQVRRAEARHNVGSN